MLHRRNKLLFIGALCALCTALATTSAAAQEKEFHPASYYVSRVRELSRLNAWSEVRYELDEALKLYPDEPDLRYFNGRYYYVVGDIERARYNLVRAAQTDEMHYRAKRLLVDVEDTLHHTSSAICYINELLEFQPYDRDMWRRKISLYRKMGNTVEADASLKRLAQIYPNDSSITAELRKRNRATWNEVLKRSNTAEAIRNLEQWLDTDPDNLEYYLELINLYERSGEYDHALGAVNRALTHFPHNTVLIGKGAGILCEQGLYTQAVRFARSHGAKYIADGLMEDVAQEARMNDPYETNGRLYIATGNRDALNYLINTALTRGYNDDAYTYLAEAMRLDGRTAPLLLKLYGLHMKTGNQQAAYRVLEELYTLNPSDEDIQEEYATLMLRMGTHEMETQQWSEANMYLQRALDLMTPEHEQWASTVSREITVLGHLGQLATARDLYRRSAVVASPEDAKRFASAYEDMAANRLRLLVEEERYEEALDEAQALLEVVPYSEAALRCCINMSQTLKRDELFRRYALIGYNIYPETPYFVIKEAVALQQQGRHAEALELVHPSRGRDEWTSLQYRAAFSGLSTEWAQQLIKDRMPDIALQVVDSALIYDGFNKELLYTKGVAHEYLKEWRPAYELQLRNYNPSNAEQQEWYEHMRYLGFRSFKNRVDLNYTAAFYDTKAGNLSSIAHLYSIASVAYTRLCKRNTYTGQISYKGIDGYRDEEEEESGGVGLEFMAQWEHQFNSRWSGMVNFAASTRYFNRFGANVSASYAANRGWTPTLRLGYRRTPQTYLFLSEGDAVRANQDEYNLVLITPSVEKSWGHIKVTGGADLVVMESSFYYNVSLKGKLFFNDDNISSVALLTGFGSFPELSFFDQTSLRNLSHTNAMVGVDFQYLCTRHLYLGLSANWNTCFDPYRADDGTLKDSYRNIFSVTFQVHTAF